MRRTCSSTRKAIAALQVGKDMSIGDPRKMTGAVWFDLNQHGRLDCFTANQDESSMASPKR